MRYQKVPDANVGSGKNFSHTNWKRHRWSRGTPSLQVNRAGSYTEGVRENIDRYSSRTDTSGSYFEGASENSDRYSLRTDISGS